ncbi:hypothetical protein EDD86DRAFT_269602 [Gorgonomyces haynaldii]|nr:hypothetical protein EDD86DRAFT_269602 [Gorgonomyces haynaldii]
MAVCCLPKQMSIAMAKKMLDEGENSSEELVSKALGLREETVRASQPPSAQPNIRGIVKSTSSSGIHSKTASNGLRLSQLRAEAEETGGVMSYADRQKLAKTFEMSDSLRLSGSSLEHLDDAPQHSVYSITSNVGSTREYARGSDYFRSAGQSEPQSAAHSELGTMEDVNGSRRTSVSVDQSKYSIYSNAGSFRDVDSDYFRSNSASRNGSSFKIAEEPKQDDQVPDIQPLHLDTATAFGGIGGTSLVLSNLLTTSPLPGNDPKEERRVDEDFPVHLLMKQLGRERKWAPEDVQQDVKTLESNRLRTVKDLRALKEESWGKIGLLPIVVDLLRDAISQ